MAAAPKKERYVIYVSPEVGEALRHEKSKSRGVTFSDIAEKALRDHFRRTTPKPAKATA